MKRTPIAPALFALLVVSSAPVLADELLRFKSGYEMMVISHREEGNLVIVTLDGGGEVGFPKDSLLMLEEGKPTTRTGPSPLLNKVPSRVSTRQFKAPIGEMPSRYLARGVTSSGGTTVGYSRHGKGQQRFSGGPLEAANANGKIGVDVRQSGKIRMPNAPPEPLVAAPSANQKPRGVEAIVPSSREGG